MKNLISYYSSGTFRTISEDIDPPAQTSLTSTDLPIKVSVAGSNPKDFKHPDSEYFSNVFNQGDDCVGTVVAVGSEARNFHPGDRVAAFHHLDTPWGTYAEYTVCPALTSFHLPTHVSDEEGATIPLAAYTAAVGLFRNLGVSAPWERGDDTVELGDKTTKVPLVVNGASLVMESFVIKLAKINPRIEPIIAVAGASGDFVRNELGLEAVLDYRSPTVEAESIDVLRGLTLNHVFDAANLLASIKYLISVLQPGSGR